MKRPFLLIPILLSITILFSACGTAIPTNPFGVGLTLTATVTLTASPTPTETIAPTQTPTPLPADAIPTFIASLNDNGYFHLFAFAPGKLEPTRLTNGSWDDISPCLSPDGQKLVFASNRNDYWDLYLLDLTTGQAARLTDTPAYDGNPSWSPDSQWVVYDTYTNDNLEINIISTVNAGQVIQLSNNSAADGDPAWSPEGRQIAFISNRTGENEVWVASLDQPDPQRFVNVSQSPEGVESHPAWSPDGSKLAWASVRANRPEEIYVWNAKAPTIPAHRLASGNWPVWQASGEQIASRIHEPNQDYIVAYNLDGIITLPVMPIPAVRGIDWRTIRVSKLPTTFQRASFVTPTQLVRTEVRIDNNIPNQRSAIVRLPNVKAPYPQLHDAVDEAFDALRQRVSLETGWDPLATLADAYEPLTSSLDPGRGEDWLYTGRAFALNALTMNVGWMVVLREDIAGQTFWRIYLRALAQDGSQGQPLPGPPWDLNARYNLDPRSYDRGGMLMESVPVGYWVDFTTLASQYGFQRLPAQNNWRTYFAGTQFNEFVRTDGLDWRTAMLQLYPVDVFLTPTVVALPTATHTRTSSIPIFNTPTPTITLTPTPRPTFTPEP